MPDTLAAWSAALATRDPPADDELARINELLRRRADEQRAVESDRRRRARRSS